MGYQKIARRSDFVISKTTPHRHVNNNRMDHADGYSYDYAGNLVDDGTLTYTYDAENRIVTVAQDISPTTPIAAYVYDAEGRRVRSVLNNGATIKDFLYNLGNNVITELSGAGAITRQEVYAGGRHLAIYNGPTSVLFAHVDWQGTERVHSQPDGHVNESFSNLPFGDGLSNIGADPKHFTGKERDSESGLDDFEARFYSSSIGRFMQVDEFSGGPIDEFDPSPSTAGPLPYADIFNPQSLNKYAYVYNNPLRYVDPNGHDAWDVIKGAANAFGSDFFGGAGRQESGNGDYKVGQAIGDFGATVVGAGETLLGAGGEVGGLTLDATGVGAVAGVPVGVVSTAAVVQGSSAVLIGGAHLLKAANDSSGANAGEKPQGPVKAKDAPGVTAGNQATNEHGQKIAPSGKPQVNNVNKTTREAAKNAANKGSGVISDRGHFHTRRGTGAKKRDGVHYNYPN